MSIETPTTAEINDNIVAQLEATLNQTIPATPKSFLRVLSRVLSGAFAIVYKYAGWIALQTQPATAYYGDTEILGMTINPLLWWGRLGGVTDPESATQAELLVGVTVNTQSGSLPSGTQFTNSDNGVTYISIGAVDLDADTVQVTIRAVSDQSGGGGAGTIGNLDAGDEVTFANKPANVSRIATVDSQSVTGADGETESAYRTRVVNRWKSAPQGGAYSDYRIWGELPTGIVWIGVYRGAGQVYVYSEATEDSSGSEDGIPTAAQLVEVYDSIEYEDDGLASRRPVGAFVNSYAITRTAFDVTVIDLTTDNATQVKTDIETALDEYLRSTEPYIVGLSSLPRTDTISNTKLSSVVSDIVDADGGTFSGIAVYVDSNAMPVYTLGEGEKAKLGTVTYSS